MLSLKSKQFIYFFFGFLAECKPHSSQNLNNAGTESTSGLQSTSNPPASSASVNFSCKSTPDAMTKYYSELSQAMQKACAESLSASDRQTLDGLDCNKGCVLGIGSTGGSRGGFEVEISKDFLSGKTSQQTSRAEAAAENKGGNGDAFEDYNGDAVISLKVNIYLPSSFKSSELTCVQPDTTNSFLADLNALYNVSCNESSNKTKKQRDLNAAEILQISTASKNANDLSGVKPANGGGFEQAVLVVKKYLAEFDKALLKNAQKTQSGKLKCPEGSFEDYLLKFGKKNPNQQSNSFSISVSTDSEFRLELNAANLADRIGLFGNNNRWKIKTIGECYPVRLHPARKLFLSWMEKNWNEICKKENCRYFIFPASGY